MDIENNQLCNQNSSLTIDTSISRLHSAAVPIVQQSMNGRSNTKSCNGSSNSFSSPRFSASSSSGDTDMHYIKASELFPKKIPWIESGLTSSSDPPFPLLHGEDILYEGRTSDGTIYVSNYRLYLHKTTQPEVSSNSGSPVVSSGSNEINIPLGLIETFECKDICYLNIYCKDARSFRLVFLSGDSCQDWFKRLSIAISLPRKPEDVFSLAFYAWTRDNESTIQNTNSNRYVQLPWWYKKQEDTFLTGEQLFRFEVERQGYDTAVTWRVTTANVDFKLSPSYPTHLLVPTSISDDMLETVAAFRSARRLPAVVWRNRRNGAVLCRCSQPEVGWLGWRSQEDENLLLSILNSCIYDCAQNGVRSLQPPPNPEAGVSPSEGWIPEASLSTSNGSSGNVEYGSLKDLSEDSSCFNQTKKMLIIDARSYTTAVANRARGGGCEFPQYYPQCDIEFMNLANIHTIRKSFLALRSLCISYNGNTPAADQSNWFAQLDSTKWLQHIANLLRAACYTGSNLEEQSRPVVVHCSDGWDRTPQIVSLAQLMIDPFYRTIKGFQILVQREWLEFGHKFADRCGLLGGCEDTNERCPVFLQFLDCVHQMLNQFPTAFEFNPVYLVKMVQHVYSNLFGTFLLNTVQERTLNSIPERSHSLWAFLLEKNHEMYNYLYQNSDEPLWPSCQIRDLQFWSAVYSADLGSRVSLSCETDGCHTNTPSTSSKSTSNSPCSSGYATPRQTGLTDSMVDALPLKNLVVCDIPRSKEKVMEDSTDTLVEDTPNVGSSMGCIDSELESSASFPLFEPEDTTDSPIWLPSLNKKGQMDFVSNLDEPVRSLNNGASKQDLAAFSECSAVKASAKYEGDCPTCQKHLDFLNKTRETSGDVVDSGSGKRDGLSFSPPENSGPRCLKFDLDGLIPTVDRLQTRLRQILQAKEAELEALRQDLRQTRAALSHQVCHINRSNQKESSNAPCTSSEIFRSTGIDMTAFCQDAASTDSSNETTSAAWVTVDTKEIDKATVAQPTRWVPDHLAPTCMKCGEAFHWMVKRRHHCRNCGEVFCAECANRDLPLPHQNLLQPARVCDTCYFSLSGQESALDLAQPDEKATHPRTPRRERASSLSNLNVGHCRCSCCQSRRSTKLKAVTAAST